MYPPFFLRFLLSTVTVSFLIVVILLVKRILKKHLSIKYQYNIWFIFLTMLAFPFISIHLFSWGNRFNVLLGSLVQRNNGRIDIGSLNNQSGSRVQNSNWLQDFTVSVNRSTPEFLDFLLLAIWITGMAILTYLIISRNRQIINIRKSIQPLQNDEIENIFNQCKDRIQIHKRFILGESYLIKTPITFGFFRPHIIMPDKISFYLSKKDIEYIFLHELYHYKRRDILVSYVMCLFQILYWFNPLVWYALKEMRTDREIACDISVLELLDENYYIEYGNTIINFADKVLQSSHLTVVADFGGSKQQIKKRIQRIASFHRESKFLKIKSSIIFILTGLFVFGNTPIISVMANDNSKYSFSDKRTVYENLSTYFDGFEGSFVLYDSQTDQYRIYNENKSMLRVSPDSTYKTPMPRFEGCGTPPVMKM